MTSPFVRRTALALGVAIAVALGVAVLRGTPSVAQQPAPAPAAPQWPAVADTAALPGPRQPVFFRHDIHASQYKISCQYCHYSVAVASEPGIPSTQTCMGCHLVIGGTDKATQAQIQKVRDSWNKKEPIQWVRVHYLARHAHFPHQRHVKAMGPNACANCHGDVSRMPQVWKVNNISNMGWCITCHLERKVNRDCSACHY